MPPSSLYGYRYSKNVISLWDVRPKKGMDLYCTDERRILKNSINDLSTDERIKKAQENNSPIIFLFGGSTMMSMGSRTPNFSIPSLIERILALKYGKETVCINFGLGGTDSKDALNLLIHDALNIANPSLVIFYDGWNCCSHFSAMIELQEQYSNEKNIDFFNGEGIKHLQNNFLLNEMYSPSWFVKRAIKLMIANILEKITKIFDYSILSRVSNAIQHEVLSLRPSNTLEKLLNRLSYDSSTTSSAGNKAAHEYLHIHETAYSICKARKIDFETFLQPLIFWGNKKLTSNEEYWKVSSDSTGANGKDYFASFFQTLQKLTRDKKLTIEWFNDITDCLNTYEEELYIDSGHLNRYGNLIVSEKIANAIFSKGYLK